MKCMKDFKFIVRALFCCLLVVELQASLDGKLSLKLPADCQGCAALLGDDEPQEHLLIGSPSRDRIGRKSFYVEADESIKKNQDVHAHAIIRQCSVEFDPKVVAYWSEPEMLRRIEMNEQSLGLERFYIFCEVVEVDNDLQKMKENKKQELYFHAYGQDSSHDVEKVKNHLWVEYLNEQKNAIHKNVEINKKPISYMAWPLIKEIHRTKGMSTEYGSSAHENRRGLTVTID